MLRREVYASGCFQDVVIAPEVAASCIFAQIVLLIDAGASCWREGVVLEEGGVACVSDGVGNLFYAMRCFGGRVSSSFMTTEVIYLNSLVSDVAVVSSHTVGNTMESPESTMTEPKVCFAMTSPVGRLRTNLEDLGPRHACWDSMLGNSAEMPTGHMDACTRRPYCVRYTFSEADTRQRHQNIHPRRGGWSEQRCSKDIHQIGRDNTQEGGNAAPPQAA